MDAPCGQWLDTDLSGGKHQSAAPATPVGALHSLASHNSKAVPAGPLILLQPQQLTAGCTNPPGKQGGCSDGRSPQPLHSWPATYPGAGDSTGIPCGVSPGASPHRDLLLCPCGNADTKVCSNASGGATAPCLEPSLGSCSVFSFIGQDNDNCSRGAEAPQGKDRYPYVNKRITKPKHEQNALTSCASGKTLGKARPENSLRTRIPCYRGVLSPPCSGGGARELVRTTERGEPPTVLALSYQVLP